MKTFGLIGKFLTHSYSQQYYINKFKQNNVFDAEYLLFSLPKIDQVKELFQHPTLLGFNVTSPYKIEIIPILDKLDSVAQEVGAVNCVIIQNGKWIGYNTDVVGFEKIIEEIQIFKFSNSKVQSSKTILSNFEKMDGEVERDSLYSALVLGSGGASKAVCYVLKRREIPYQIVSRQKTQNTIAYEEITKILINNYTLIINTTPLGMYPNVDKKPPLPYSSLNRNHILIDLIYNPEETLFLKEGKKNGATTINGETMFYAQAEANYLKFNDIMKLKKIDNKFIRIKKYLQFHFHKYEFIVKNNCIFMQFFFQTNELVFAPKMSLYLGKYAQNMNKKEMEGLVFNIGLIELISYWKATCSPTIVIHNYTLNEKQQNWWKKLYYKGLSEFFYQNKIITSFENFVQFSFPKTAKPYSELSFKKIKTSPKVIVPIGGGKDSVVTLEELKAESRGNSCSYPNPVIPFIINPRGATLDCARVAGFKTLDEIVILEREIDKNLLKCNEDGFLNGHTPFSAMLAFYTLLVSYGTDCREIVLSNEASANEATVLGTDVNHQYSKSLEFETDFQQYVKESMGDCAFYYSYLRTFSELQIAEKFAQYPQYFSVFRSCNAGSKENRWCCNCPKCLFAYIILAPFIDKKTRLQIFGEDLLQKPEMEHFFNQLIGKEATKPFECVGTVEEVVTALKILDNEKEQSFLLEKFRKMEL